MIGTFEKWLAADREWASTNLPLLRDVFVWFTEHGDWPEIQALQHDCYKRGDRTTKVQQVANAKPTIPGQLSLGVAQSLGLGARHLLGIREARPLLRLTVRATHRAVQNFLDVPAGAAAAVTAIEIRDEVMKDPPGDDRSAEMAVGRVLPMFTAQDHPTPFAGGGISDDWSLNVNPSLVMQFEDIATPEDYVERQLEIVRTWATDCESQVSRAQIRSDTQPHRAFVVMPFGEAWSDDTRHFIRDAVDGLGGELIAIRADEIAAPGKITQQIATELVNCDLIIADITGNNPNVAWELGFAFAHAKPCVILRRREPEHDTPFDLYDHRRIDYADPPTTDDQDRLQQLIRGAIEQIGVADQTPDLGSIFKNA